MARSIWWRSLVALGATVALVAPTGCAYTLGAVFKPDGADLKKSPLSYLPQRGGMRLVIMPRKPSNNWLFPTAAVLGDLVAGGNGALLLFTYGTEGQGYAIATIAALALTAADLGGYYAFGPGRGDPARDLLTAENLSQARIQLAVKASAADTVVVEGLQLRGDLVSGYAPLTSRFVGKPLLVQVMDRNGRLLFQEETELAADPWLAYLPGSAPQKPAPPPEAARVTPPSLSSSVTLEDPLDSKAVHAQLGGKLVVTAENKGPGDALGVRARLAVESAPSGLSVPEEILIGDLAPKTTRTVAIPLSASADLPDATASVRVMVEDANGFDSAPSRIVFQTLALRLPDFAVEEAALTDYDNGFPEKGEQLLLKVRVRNGGKTEARGAKVRLQSASKDVRMPDSQFDIGDLPVGAWKVATFSVFVPNKYAGPDELPLKLAFDELREGAHKVSPVAAKLRSGGTGMQEVRMEAESPTLTAMSLPAPSLNIDVDLPIPNSRPVDKDAIGIIIGIERYNAKVPGVPFAVRDATVIKEYFQDVLGVPPDNIRLLTNEQATKGAIETVFEGELPGLITPGKSRVYVYYAGHGVPDPESKTPFLVPYDGNPQFAKTSCYPMDAFYSKLGSLDIKGATVMLDACFSGQAGRAKSAVGLIAQARPLFIAPVMSSLPAKVTVLAAASGDQVSSGYPDKQHGLFTYFLMKGLRGQAMKNGRLTVADLQKYLSDEVPRIARRMGRTQTPMLLGGRKDDVLVDR